LWGTEVVYLRESWEEGRGRERERKRREREEREDEVCAIILLS
jgi:hypothetical protein